MKVLAKMKKPLIITLLAVMAISYYIYLSNRDVSNKNTEKEETEISKIIGRNLELNYPETPKAVVAYYSDIVKQYYRTSTTDDQLIGLAQHARELFDDELLSYNTYDSYMSRLAEEVACYRAEDKYITDYTIENGYNIDYIEDGGKSYAKIDVKYFVRTGKNVYYAYEKYTLRKDDNDRWKILCWEISDETAMEE